jgi:hypothetical protein
MEIKGLFLAGLIPDRYREWNELDAKLINFFSDCKSLIINFVNIGILRLECKIFGIKEIERSVM